MNGRRLTAGCLGLVGWALVGLTASVWWAVESPEFQQIHQEVSPVEPISVSEQRFFMGLVVGVPGCLLMGLGAYLWISEGRRRRSERRRWKARRSWSLELLDEAIDGWLEERRRPSPEELVQLYGRLDMPRQIYLARFAAGAGFHRLDEPVAEPEPPPKDPSCGWWLATFFALAVAAFAAFWVVLSTVWIPNWAESRAMDVPLTDYQAYWGLRLGLGVATLPGGLGLLLLGLGSRRYARNRRRQREDQERRSRERDTLEQRLARLRTDPGEELDRAFEQGLLAAAEPEETP